MAIDLLKQEINKTINLLQYINEDDLFLGNIIKISNLMIQSINCGNKIIFAGNGGSAADSQHLAAELVSKLCTDRNPLPGIAITTDTSALTAIANDYGYEKVFARQIAAIGQKGDLFIAITTSGNSKNIIEAIKTAKDKNITVVGLTGNCGGLIKDLCDEIIIVPSSDTAKIQECHILIGHILCLIAENYFIAKEKLEFVQMV